MNLIENKEWEKLYKFILKTGSKNDINDYIDTVIKEINNIIPYYAANFFIYSNNDKVVSKLQCVNIPQKAIDEYEEYYYKIDDIKEKTFNQRTSIKSTDIMNYREWEKTEYFNDFLYSNRLYYLCGIDIHYQDQLLGTIGLFRRKSDPDYSIKDLHILNTLKNQLSNQMYKLYLIDRMKNNKAEQIGLKLESSENKFDLTERELEVIDHVIDGKNNRQLADELFISINTVKKHLNNIFRKTEVTNRTELTSLIFNL